MSLIGYARTSTVEQEAGYEAQVRDLKALGCTEIFSEQISSVVAVRPELDRALERLTAGDTLVVTKLDRLARSVRNLSQIVDRLEGIGAKLRIMDFGGMSVDTGGPTGRLMLNVFGAFAQFEREIMLQRQREGIAKARADGKYRGRKPTARAKAPDVRRLAKAGVSRIEISRRLEIGQASVWRILGPAKPAAATPH